MATRQHTVGDRLATGNEALARGAWEEARGHFEASLAESPSAEAYEGLSWATWWLDDADGSLGAREQAFRAYRAAGKPGAAGRMAAWLSADHRDFRGDDAVGQGWLNRARRLLADLPEGPDHGWLAVMECNFAQYVLADLDVADRAARTGARIGREHGVPDLESIGLAQEGTNHVLRGRIDEGMRCLDEAAVIAAGEDLQLPVSPGWTVCCMISACDGVGDFPRAAHWCDAMRGYADRWGGRLYMGMCRTSYGRVLATRGDWAAADGELTAAAADMVASRPGLAAPALARLGELRARQARIDEARELFERAGSGGIVGLGELALDGGDAAAAGDAAERALRRLSDDDLLGRVAPLGLLVRARSAHGRHDEAATALADLTAACVELGTPYLRARARLVAGEVAFAQGDTEEARRAFEDAIDSFGQASAPYDAAVARLGLARALATLGRDEAAAAEALAAREAFVALGASRDVERADEPLAAADERPSEATGELTTREVEILRLVAQGLSDAQIAERLVVSPHTVHRHVANVRAKLRLPSRAAAVAYASRANLL